MALTCGMRKSLNMLEELVTMLRYETTVPKILTVTITETCSHSATSIPKYNRCVKNIALQNLKSIY
jgi:hypothetical protein